MLTCEKCGASNDTVSTVEIGSYAATVGNLCNTCKVQINVILVPIIIEYNNKLYEAATKWLNPDKYFLAS